MKSAVIIFGITAAILVGAGNPQGGLVFAVLAVAYAIAWGKP